ncbi:2-succinyl-5-enolpyruvyl-6-hydroxy-3-cyclohexene-1-carboxylic-acid synthase [candidate division KSB1 bacterium]
MNDDSLNINHLWSVLLIEELVRNGVRYFCISPGSRSTPLTVAAARNPDAATIICYDERGAAFHALGYARAQMRPAAVISTSGTATANYYPAVIEASVDGIPLVVLTADRPPELRSTGANQTIDQPGIYGGYVRWQFDMPCPDEKIPLSMVLTTIDQAVYRAQLPPAGPVHINCMFREPLEPKSGSLPETYFGSIREWRSSREPHTRYHRPERTPDINAVQETAAILKRSERGLLAAGRLTSEKEIRAVADLSQILKWPLFADITSGLRLQKALPYLIPYYDQLLFTRKFREEYVPDTILHIGGQITSKRFLALTENAQVKRYLLVRNDPFRHDPGHTVTHRIDTEIDLFCAQLSENVETGTESRWLEPFTHFNGNVETLIEKSLLGTDKLSEPGTARIISNSLHNDHNLFLASSMPIRDMDMYAVPGNGRVIAGSNRGASGIDGTIAAAAGFAAGMKSDTTLLIGDIAAIHDCNSLSQLNRINQTVTVVIVNNGGGGIFSFLPIAEYEDVFEQYFGTPHDYNFSGLASAFNIDYYHPAANSELIDVYRNAVKNGSPALIEVTIDRKENAELHKTLKNLIIKSIDS